MPKNPLKSPQMFLSCLSDAFWQQEGKAENPFHTCCCETALFSTPVYVYAYRFDQLDESGGASRALCRRASGRLDEKHRNPKVVEGKLHLRNSKRTRIAGDVLDHHCTSFVSMSDDTAALQCADGSQSTLFVVNKAINALIMLIILNILSLFVSVDVRVCSRGFWAPTELVSLPEAGQGGVQTSTLLLVGTKLLQQLTHLLLTHVQQPL